MSTSKNSNLTRFGLIFSRTSHQNPLTKAIPKVVAAVAGDLPLVIQANLPDLGITKERHENGSCSYSSRVTRLCQRYDLWEKGSPWIGASSLSRRLTCVSLLLVPSGMIRRSLAKDGGKKNLGLGRENSHIYRARVGLFDLDYAMHMNNAAFLSHAEYARWQMGAETGMMQSMVSHNIYLIATANYVRYRREVRPLFRSFQIESWVSAMDERNLWFIHNLRLDDTDRLRAQIFMQACFVQNGKVVSPRVFFHDVCGVADELIDRVTWPDGQDVLHPDLLNAYRDLDDNMRRMAALDDEKQKQGNK